MLRVDTEQIFGRFLWALLQSNSRKVKASPIVFKLMDPRLSSRF
jgi:hypothetical protein